MSELNMWKYKQGGEMVVDDNEAQRVENEIKGAKPANAIKDVRNWAEFAMFMILKVYDCFV